MKPRKAQAGEMPDLRLRQGRARHHGAADRQQQEEAAGSCRRRPPAAAPAPAPSTEVTAPAPASTPLLMAQERELRAKLKDCATTSSGTPTMSASAFPTRRARCITATSSTARSTARPRPDEARALVEEGVEVSPLPVLPGRPELGFSQTNFAVMAGTNFLVMPGLVPRLSGTACALSCRLLHGCINTNIAVPLRRTDCAWFEVKSGLLWLGGWRGF